MTLMVWSKEDCDSEGYDSEGLVIWFLRGGDRWYGCVDWLSFEWLRKNKWLEWGRKYIGWWCWIMNMSLRRNRKYIYGGKVSWLGLCLEFVLWRKRSCGKYLLWWEGIVEWWGLYLVLLLWNVWDHLENDIFYRLKHNLLEGWEALIEVFCDCEVV